MERTKPHVKTLTIALSLLLMLAAWATLVPKADAEEVVTMTDLAADETGNVYTNNSSFTISTKDELITFSALVNGGKDFTGKTVTLLSNIELNDTSGMTDMTAWRVENPEGVTEWTPIGTEAAPFKGTFDGGNKTVSGMYIWDTETTALNYGFFGYSTGTIMDLTIKKSLVNAYQNVGVICGQSKGKNALISGCRNEGEVYASNEDSRYIGGICGYSNFDAVIKSCTNAGNMVILGIAGGGICGYSSDAIIEDCTNEGDIQIGKNSGYGGVCAFGSSSTITRCSNSGDISLATGKSGANLCAGICATLGSDTTVNFCYNTGNIAAKNNAGGIIGKVSQDDTVRYCYSIGEISVTETNTKYRQVGDIYAYYESGKDNLISDCYYLNTSTLAQKDYATPLSDEVMKSANFILMLGSATQSGTDEKGFVMGNVDYPYPVFGSTRSHFERDEYNFQKGYAGNEADPYVINTKEKLYCLTYYVNSGLDSFVGDFIKLDINIEFNEKEEWEPIGTVDHPFAGTFDGGNHTVSKLRITNKETLNHGLFGYNTGTIKNLVIDEISGDDEEHGITAQENLGAVCGYNKGGSIINCGNNGDFCLYDGAKNYTGGVCGTNDGGTIKDCFNTGYVKGEQYVGGVCGYNINGAKLEGCYNTGDVVATYGYAGGVCAYSYIIELNASDNEVLFCYNSGKVSCGNHYMYAGGVCGAIIKTTMIGCYNTNMVTAGSVAGGVCGSVGASTLRYCFNGGNVDGGNSNGGGSICGVGGICGIIDKESVINDVYSVGTVAVNKNVGDIYGGLYGSETPTLSNCFYLDSSLLENKNGTTTISTGELKSPRFLFTLGLESKVSADDVIFMPSDITGYDYPVPGTVGLLDANADYNFLNAGDSNGTSDKPFIIDNMEKLYYLSYLVNSGRNNFDGKYISLGGNILFGDDDYWVPAGTKDRPFQGTFDGKRSDYSITGLKIDEEEGEYKGLFGNNAGTIQNVSIVNCNIKALNYVGGICAYNTGNIEGCSCAGKIDKNTQKDGQYFGGICGQNESTGTINQCQSSADVGESLGKNVGGICGNNLGTISYCSVNANINGNEYVGGISGYNDGNILFCFAKGTLVNGSDNGFFKYFGGISGYNKEKITNCYSSVSCERVIIDEDNPVDGVSKGGEVKNSYYNREVWEIVNDKSASAYVSALTTGQMKSLGFILLINHGNTDTQGFVPDDGVTNGGYPVFGSTVDYASDSDYNFMLSAAGTQETPYIITTADQLYYFAYLVNSQENDFNLKYLKLGNDINLANTTECSWIPIGRNGATFRGTFDGAGYSVSGIYIDGNNFYQGFFGDNNGTIQNLNIKASTINGYCYVAGVCANSFGYIKNCSSAATVKGVRIVGGICGFNYKEISSCYNIGTVTGKSQIGAICGYDSTGVYTNCCYLKTSCAYAVQDTSNVNVTPLTQTQFENGAATWCLNGNTTTNPVWYQTTIGTNKNQYPVQNQTAGVVYQIGDNDFSNYYFKDVNIELGSDIAMNYYITSSLSLDGKKMKFTMNGQAVETEWSTKVEGDGDPNFKFVYSDIAPQYIGDEVTAELLDTDGVTVLATKNYSVLTYLNTLKGMTFDQLSMEQDAKTKMDTLIDNLLYYGAAAQTYTGHKTDHLIADLSGMTFTELTETSDITNVSNGTEVEFLSATLFFSNVNMLKFKFTTTDIANTVIKISSGEGAETVTDIKTGADGKYYVLTGDIKATDFDTCYTVKAYVKGTPVSTLEYNVNSYVYGMQNSESENMKNLARATYNYGKSASDFIQKGEQ